MVAYSWCRRRRWLPTNLECMKVSENGIAPMKYPIVRTSEIHTHTHIYKFLLTWPAVSHSCSLTVRSSKYIVLLRKSMPIVAWYVLSNVSYINLKIVNDDNSTLLRISDTPGNKTRLPDALVTKQNDFRSLWGWRGEVCGNWCRRQVWHLNDREELERNKQAIGGSQAAMFLGMMTCHVFSHALFLSQLLMSLAHLIMKLSDQIKACHDSQPFYTFEFFPPRTDQVRLGQLFQIMRLALILSRHPGIWQPDVPYLATIFLESFGDQHYMGCRGLN